MDSLTALLHNEIPAIVMPQFATPAECRALVARAREIGFQRYQQVSPPIDRIGVTVFEYHRIGMAAYFHAAEAARILQRQVFGGSFDPLRRMIELLAANHPGRVDVAVDPQFGAYYAGLIRRIEAGTLLHVDFAAAEHSGWHVASVGSQLAWNVYLDLEGGEVGVTHVHDRSWQPPCERFKLPDSYGYRRDVLDGAGCFSYRPHVGELCIINTRNFHEVEPSTGARVTFTSALGSFGDDLCLWS